MSHACLLYYITDRKAFGGSERARRRQVMDKIAEAARAGVDRIQLREKDLSARELESLAHEAMSLIEKLRTENPELRTALLLNSRCDIAMAVQADGVHLRSDDIAPRQLREIWSRAHRGGQRAGARAPHPLIGVSCHSSAQVSNAAAEGADFAVAAPVFEKKGVPNAKPTGLEWLREASKAGIPVLALGGVTLSNARACLEAGAAGIAAIRLFQENDIRVVARALRGSWQ